MNIIILFKVNIKSKLPILIFLNGILQYYHYHKDLSVQIFFKFMCTWNL